MFIKCECVSPPGSCGLGRQFERARCVRHRGGAAGQGAPREALSPQEDQTGGHDQALVAGKTVTIVILAISEFSLHPSQGFNKTGKPEKNSGRLSVPGKFVEL